MPPDVVLRAISDCPGFCDPQNGTTQAAHPEFAERLELTGISDAAKVNDFLYRGGQPNQQGVEQLKKLGVDTIVDLRGEWRGTIESERRRAEMRTFHFHGFWHPAMKAYIRDLPPRLNRSAELAPYRQISPAKDK